MPMSVAKAYDQARARWGDRAVVGIHRCMHALNGEHEVEATFYVGVAYPEQSKIDHRGLGSTFEEAFEDADRRG